jgi:HD-like signal output (HDOD) protein
MSAALKSAQAVPIRADMTNPHSSPAAATPATSAVGFQFVRDLAASLSDGSISLPSYPKVALRLQKLLADDDTDAERLVRVLGAEPVLTARITTMANSAAINPTRRKVNDLRTAVVLLGHDTLRTTAAAFAMMQLRQAEEYRSIEKPMAILWRESVGRAAMSFVVARQTGRFGADTAMLAGILSGIGKLYLLARASKYPELFKDEETYQAIVRDWHASIAQALLESWETAPEIIAAVRDWTTAVDEAHGGATLADVLSAADLLVSYSEQPELLQGVIGEHRPMVRLGLKAGCASLLADSATELTALREALGA